MSDTINTEKTNSASVTTQSATPSAPTAPTADDKLYTFYFVLTDGTIASVRAHDRLEAARILRGS